MLDLAAAVRSSTSRCRFAQAHHVHRSRLLTTSTKIWTEFCVAIKRNIPITSCIVSHTTRLSWSAFIAVIHCVTFLPVSNSFLYCNPLIERPAWTRYHMSVREHRHHPSCSRSGRPEWIESQLVSFILITAFDNAWRLYDPFFGRCSRRHRRDDCHIVSRSVHSCGLSRER